MDFTIERSYEEFTAYLKELVDNGEKQTNIAAMLDINDGYVSMMLNDPDYYPSRRVRVKCNIRTRKRDRRVIIHAGSDMVERAKLLEELTEGKYTITRAVPNGKIMACPACGQRLLPPEE